MHFSCNELILHFHFRQKIKYKNTFLARMFSLFKSNRSKILSACHSRFHYQLFLNEMTVPESTKKYQQLSCRVVCLLSGIGGGGGGGGVIEQKERK